MRVLVVGASGFLGAHLLSELVSRGHEVVGTSRKQGVFTALDITDADACRRLIGHGRFDAVVNLAGVGVSAGSATLSEMTRVNSVGAATLAYAALTASNGTVWFVNAASSTQAAAEQGAESDYGTSKAAGSAVVKDLFERSSVPFASAIVHNSYGSDQPSERFIMSVFIHLRSGRQLHIMHPERVRDFCYVDDVTSHLADLAESPQPQTVESEIGTGTGTTLWDAAQMIRESLGASEALITRQDQTLSDAHLWRVADRGATAFLACRCSLPVGIERVAATLR